jgi:hypothetical protein
MDDRQPGLAAVGNDGVQRAQQRLGQHHHAGPAAKGTVIYPAVGAVGKVPQRPQPHIDLPGFEGTAGDALCQVRAEQFWEQRDDVETHSRQ